MGKYRKTKTAGEVSQSSLGVQTRAKTLALQRLQKSSTSPATVASTLVTGQGSYLQLRSRRLEKPPIVLHHHDSKRQKQQQQQQQRSKKESYGKPNSNSGVRVGSGLDSVAEKKKEGEVGREETVQEDNGNDNIINYSNVNNNNESKDFGDIEASFGENVLDIEVRERESTPCSLIRDPEIIRTPSSSTRSTSLEETNQKVQNSARYIPTTHEMNEFFAVAKEEHQRRFIEKYTIFISPCFSLL
ncbi:hypothetical protein REPUB_Repub20aG0062000 [Reevesia pubescens]